MTKKSSAVNKAIKSGKSKAVKKQTRKTVVKLSNKQLNEMLSQARELQWAGQHEKAIEVCTQALDAIGNGNTRTAQIQMELLDTRAESSEALLQNDAVKKDAKLMMQVANAAPVTQKKKNLAYKVKALIWKGRVQRFIDNNNDLAKKTLSNALNNARQSNNTHLEAETLSLLMFVQQTFEQAIEIAQKAAELFRTLDNQRKLAEVLPALAWAYARAGRIEEARQYTQSALNISEQIGYNYGKGWAIGALAFLQTEIAQALILEKQSLQAYKASGNLGAISDTTNNIGFYYSLLGLYPRALRYYQKSLDIKPENSVPLSNTIHIEIEQRFLESARQHLTFLRSLPFENSGFVEEIDGKLILLEGKPKIAINHIKKAIRLNQKVGNINEIGGFALLGETYLASKNLTAALKATTSAVKKHRELNFSILDDHPHQNIWWRHVQALQANKKKVEADDALEIAYDFLLKGIENLRDEGLRRNYLNKVRINREIVQAWDKHAAKCKLPKERRLAHLEVESSLREPFERLAEISLELNALHSLEEIQTFLVEEATELSGGERVLLILEKDGELELAESLLPHPQPFSQKEKGARVPLSNGRGVRGEGKEDA
jgi:tetratricopeptide (TPR) repeat protein